MRGVIGAAGESLSAYPAPRASWPPRSGASRRSARVPPSRAAGRLRPPRLQLPLGLGVRRRRTCSARSTPSAGSAWPRTRCACCRRPAPTGWPPPRRTPSCSRAPPRSRSACCADLARPPRRRDRDARASDRVLLRRVRRATARSRSTRAASARSPATSSRRPPTARWPLVAVGLLYRNGYFRQRIDARRLAARVLGRHRPGPPARRARHAATTASRSRSPCRSRDVRGHRADLARRRRRASRCSCSTPTARRTRRRRAGSRRGCTSATRTRAWRSTCCSASAACGRWRRSGSSRASCTSTRATRRSCRSSSPAASTAATARWPPALEIGARADDLHHPHAGPGRQRHLSRPAGRRDARARSPATLGRRRRGDHRARPHEPGRGAPSRSASRSSRCARRRAANGVSPPPRRGRARDVAADVGRPRGRRRPDHLRHQRRAHPDLAGPADVASCSTATSARTGWTARPTRRPGRRSTTSPRKELWAVRTRAARRS